ncbi:SDR family NAD(P)-dependent oxidoreductase [Ligilactobacillus sp. LYQ60]|uniref:SDR family NAD(P)-dependent oxidoreductase n=1 Tax=unclassified Ligilactobacillus TaxID=2767920 RepID=UPI003852B0B1
MVKRILVTGATRGIGRATAQAAMKQGLAVILHGRNRHRLNQVRQTLLAHYPHGECRVLCCDVVDRSAVGKACRHLPPVDYLVNNAGTVADAWWTKMTARQWDTVIATNLTGVFNITRAVVPKMRAGGAIIMMTSQGGLLGNPGQANYAATKGALVSLTYTLARELTRYHLRVNAVAPAARTDMTRPVMAHLRERYGGHLPAEWHLGSATAVGQFIVTQVLSTPQTGCVFAVNGSQVGYWTPPQYHDGFPQ